MPKLLARMDDAGWLTPAMAELLLPLPPLPYDEVFVAAQAKSIERVLREAEAPVRVVGRSALPSHTLFIVQPSEVGRLRNRRLVGFGDVKAAVPQLSKALEAEVDVLAEMVRPPGAMGVLVRNDRHRPLALRSLFMQPAFQESDAITSLVLGLDLQQAVVVRSLPMLSHLLILGVSAAKTHYLHSILTTLLLFNTPADLQLALLGDDPATFRPYLGVPHLLGRPLVGADEGRVAVQRMAKEVARRADLLTKQGAADLDAYNAQAGSKPLPRILLVIDALSGPGWGDGVDAWAPALARLLEQGARLGLHALVVSQTSAALPAGMLSFFGAQLVLPAAKGELARLSLKGVPLRFVDALLVEGEAVTPLEQCTVQPDELKALVTYWQRAAQQQAATVEQRTVGATGSLSGSGEAYDADARPPSETEQVQERVLPRARALAAYLGWLSVGPLCDVLGLDGRQAQLVMNQLRDEGLLEPKVAPTLRYQRLSAPPEGQDE